MNLCVLKTFHISTFSNVETACKGNTNDNFNVTGPPGALLFDVKPEIA